MDTSQKANLDCEQPSDNVNSPEYWNWRFGSGDWEARDGRQQTANFANEQIKQIRLMKLPADFRGTILDFGCGLGDAIPVYRQAFPNAKLLGVDISRAAIDLCRKRYGSLATFLAGDYTVIPNVDVIIASNVLEHLDNDSEIASHLLSKCLDLFVIVPYRESPLIPEHVNYYDEDSFSFIQSRKYRIFSCKGWTQPLHRLITDIYFMNLFRMLLGKTRVRKGMQIIYHFSRH